ncbi:MAG: DUF2997 domain-containing protein [Anaerolineales bacterium]|nr:DUF2997 domain-containing protein [Anaerolineales bacterium]
MQSQEIEFQILPDGRIEYTIKGVKGPACEEISALLERLGTVEKSERTGEFYEDDTRVDVTIAGG